MRKLLAASVALFVYAGAVQAMTPVAPKSAEETCSLCCPRFNWICFPTPYTHQNNYCEPGIGGC